MFVLGGMITLAAALASLATAAFVPALYVFGITKFMLFGWNLNLIDMAPYGFFAYVLFNMLTWASRPRDGFLQGLDEGSSFLAALSVTFSTIAYWRSNPIAGYEEATFVHSILIATALFAWFDIVRHILVRTGVAAPAAAPAVPAGHASTVFVVAAVLLVFGGIVVFALGINPDQIRSTIGLDSGKSAMSNRGVCEKIPNGVDADGKPKFVFAC